MIEEVEDWTTPIQEFIIHEKLPEDPTQVRKIRTTSAKYILMDNQLYRNMGNWPLLKCVKGKDGRYVLWEIHEGICGSHIGVKVLETKAMRLWILLVIYERRFYQLS